MKKRYRIIQGQAYDGCIPITIYFVQVREEGMFTDKWRNVKGFDRYARAEELYNLLSNND